MSFLENGYELINDILSHQQLQSINLEIGTTSLISNTGGIRNTDKKFPTINKLAHSEQLMKLASNYLPKPANLVRAILFEKTGSNNWFVTWHQDKTVAVSSKFSKDGWGPWSIKDGVNHVQPPVEVLNQMVTLRVHLDDTNQNNGCLKILPKSHLLGLLNSNEIREYTNEQTVITCEATARSILVMRPHILHASSKGTQPSRRRIIHLEYSCFKLPDGVHWS